MWVNAKDPVSVTCYTGKFPKEQMEKASNTTFDLRSWVSDFSLP